MIAHAALYGVRISHVRTAPIHNSFTYRGYQWLVDLDAIPVLPRPLRLLASFRTGDHFGDPARSIRSNVEAFCATHGIDVERGRILLLTQARVFGYVFNPLSVFWCYDALGNFRCAIAEVHNTYGERHCYLVRTDSRGRASTAKDFYVSPFYPVDGQYQMSLPIPDDQLALTVTLHRDGERPFVASVHGDRIPATYRSVLRLALRHPMAPLHGTIRIRRQGIALWLRGLRPVTRPAHHQEGV